MVKPKSRAYRDLQRTEKRMADRLKTLSAQIRKIKYIALRKPLHAEYAQLLKDRAAVEKTIKIMERDNNG